MNYIVQLSMSHCVIDETDQQYGYNHFMLQNYCLQ